MFEWMAFHELTTDRALGMAAGPIPWTAIDAYARRFGVDDVEEFEIFSGCVRSMDAAWLTYTREKADQQ